MRIVVSGSRAWPQYAKKQIWDILDEFNSTTFLDFVGVGDASGVDRFTYEWLQEVAHLPRQVFYADWDRYKKDAGPIRNRAMLKDVNPDFLAAFLIPREDCRGTWDCIEAAQELGIRVEPFRLK